MRIVRHSTSSDFLAAAEPYLRAHETTDHLIVAIARRQSEGAFLATVSGDPVGGVALQTPPYPLLVSELPEAALDPLVEALVAAGFEPPGVTGPSATAQSFAARWCARRRLTPVCRVRLRSHFLERVENRQRARGSMRPAGESDLPTLAGWYEHYFRDTRSPNHEQPLAATTRLLAATFLWEVDSLPVSMASIAGRTPRGARIGYVFTEPGSRRCGYAEALVASLSAQLLAAGARWCFLYTDADNPTSNAIYRRIGYEANREVEEIAFDPAP